VKVLYLAPDQEIPGGMRGYTRIFSHVIEVATGYRPLMPDRTIDIVEYYNPSIETLRRCWRDVDSWRKSGLLSKIDIIHADIGAFQYYEFWRFSFLRKIAPDIPAFITLHDPPNVVLYYYRYLIGRELNRPLRLLHRLGDILARRIVHDRLFNGLAGILALTSAGVDSIRRAFHRHRNTVRYLPFIIHYPEQALANNDSDASGLHSNRRLLFFSYIARGKGIEKLISMFKSVSFRYADVELWLCGDFLELTERDKGYRYELNSLIDRLGLSGKVRVTGKIPADQVIPLLRTGDIFVLPSTPPRRRGIPASSSLLNGMSAGLPVVAMDIPSYREEVKNGWNGFLVPPGDFARFQEKVEYLLEHEEERRRMGENSFRHVMESHSVSAVAETLKKIYSVVA